MTATRRTPPQRHSVALRCAARVAALFALASLASCGGAGNPPLVDNPGGTSGQKLSFVYFQKCINPVFLAQLQINVNGTISTNTCAASGCHDNIAGSGGALRVVGAAAVVNLADPTNTADVVRTKEMYKNYYSALGSTVPGAPSQSRLLNKPLLQGVLHGGGLIFLNDQDPNAKLLRYWISRPAPQGQDEFSASANSMFTPNDPQTGTCNTD